MSKAGGPQIVLQVEVPTAISESKRILDESVLKSPRNKALFTTAEWTGDTLYVESVFGKGTLQVEDHKLLIEITLSTIGLAVKSTMVSELKKRISDAFQTT